MNRRVILAGLFAVPVVGRPPRDGQGRRGVDAETHLVGDRVGAAPGAGVPAQGRPAARGRSHLLRPGQPHSGPGLGRGRLDRDRGGGREGATHLGVPELVLLPGGPLLRRPVRPADRSTGGGLRARRPHARIEGAPEGSVPLHDLRHGAGGHVSVWACAGRVIREVATFRAAPADLPWTDVIATPRPTRAQHVRQVLEERQTPGEIALQRSPSRMALWDEFPAGWPGHRSWPVPTRMAQSCGSRA